MPFEVLTLDKAAERAGISLRKLRSVIRTDAGPMVTRIGARRFVRSDKLMDWLERCTQQPPPPPAQAA